MKDYVKGDTDKAKFNSINKTFQSFSRRLGKRIIGVIPPVPIFENIQDIGEDGIIIQRMFPLNGMITRVVMSIERYEGKKTVEFELSAVGAGSAQMKKFNTRKPLIIEHLNLPVDAGDLVTLRVTEPERIKGIHIGAAFDVAHKDMKKDSYLIEEFESMMENK